MKTQITSSVRLLGPGQEQRTTSLKLWCAIAFMILGINTSFSQVKAIKSEIRPETAANLKEETANGALSNIPTCFCCDDAFNLPKSIEITGLASSCAGTPLIYTIAACKGAAYSWSVTPAIVGTMGGTTKIFTLPATTPAGTYVVSVKISCGRNSTTGSRTVIICAKQNPSFTTTTTANSVTFTSTVQCTNLWYLFEDKNNNCTHEAATENPVLGQSGQTATFNNLVVNKQYVIHHYVQCACEKGAVCQSFQAFCFRWLPAQMKSAGGNSGGKLEVISDKEITDLKEVPAEILKKIEQEKK